MSAELTDLRDEVAGVLAHRVLDGRVLSRRQQLAVADALMPLIAQREAAARADERERVARRIEAAARRGGAW